MRRVLILLLALILVTGCDNKEENEKSEYLDMKSDLLERKKFTDQEKITCDIKVDIDRKDEEMVSYKVTLSNPKENMHDIRMLVVHNYYTEEVFPSIGLFNKTKDLLIDKNSDSSSIKLSGTIKTTDDIENIDLKLKIYIKYTDDNDNEKDIYYKTT